MKTNDSTNACPKCGAPVPPDAPQGLCPKCVFAWAVTSLEPAPPPAASEDIPSLAQVGAAFPQLEILELIGRGGMGCVFKARQPHLDRFVALKLLSARLARDPQFAERFTREARVLAKLSHPNIVNVFDFGRSEPFYFLLMEFVDGVNLRQAMRAGRFSPAEALSIVPKICEALQFAHEQGILHRDIKPENILLDTRGRIKIADFGIAKLIGDNPRSVTLTGTGAALGTPNYMAPEQLENPAGVDQRADIYSLGVVFYEMLTGELPIGRFAAPSAKTPVTPALDEVVFRTLEQDREKRYGSAGEVKTDVEQIASTSPPAQQEVSDESVPTSPERRARVWVSTLEHTWSWLGLHYPNLRRGELILWPDRLEFVADDEGRRIQLRDVTGLGLVPTPRYGWRRRPLRLAITSKEGSTEGNLEIEFTSNAFTSRAESEKRAAEWLEVLTQRVAARTGAAPTAEAIDRAMGEAYSDKVTRRLWNELSVPLGALVLAFLTGSLLWGLALVLGVMLVSRITLASRRRMLRLRAWAVTSRPGTITSRKSSGAAEERPAVSRKALWGAALVGAVVIVPVIVAAALLSGRGGVGVGEIWLTLGSIALPGLAGTLLGWLGLTGIRDSGGTVRGLPLALFATLALPLAALVGLAIGIPVFVIPPALEPSLARTLGRILMLILPAGALTFSLWTVYATVQWATRQPAPPRRGILKWIFVAILLAGLGMVLVTRHADSRPERIENHR